MIKKLLHYIEAAGGMVAVGAGRGGAMVRFCSGGSV